MANKVQIIKGFLDGFVLSVLENENLFTTDIIHRLDELGYKNLSEGTIYPLLLRLESSNLISSDKVYNALGPSKKKYKITPQGLDELQSIKDIWQEFKTLSDSILGGH
ncbi:MAG: PadR family transcriptional regulator [Acholeplasma sp.]|nr:PadR family transcriptional regulator [Acholeplasma sp.]